MTAPIIAIIGTAIWCAVCLGIAIIDGKYEGAMNQAQAMNVAEDIVNLKLANALLRHTNERLIEEQKGLIGALAVGIEQAKRYPDDGLLKTFIGCAERHISTALKTP